MFRESLIYISGKILPSAITFVMGMALTWMLDPADYGTYGLGMAVATLVASVAFEGHAIGFLRFYQSNADSAPFMTTVVCTFLMLCAASGILALAVAATGLLSVNYCLLIAVCVPGCWCYSWFELAARIHIARFNPVAFFWMNLTRNLGILVFTLTLAWLTKSPLAVLAGAFLAMLLAALVRGPSLGGVRPSLFSRSIARRLFVFGWPVALSQTMGAVSFATDRFVLDIYVGSEAVGFYTVAYALAQTTLATIGSGIDSAAYSRAVRVADLEDKAAFRSQLSLNCTLLLLFLVPAAVGAAMVAPAVARLLVSPDYRAPVAGLIGWMAVSALILGFRANYIDHAFHFANRPLLLAPVLAVLALVNLVADLILIPRFGVLGAAYASIISGLVALVVGTIASRLVVRLPFPKAEIAKITVATGLMALFLWPFRENDSPQWLAVQIGGGVTIYSLALLALDAAGLRRLVRARLAGVLGRGSPS